MFDSRWGYLVAAIFLVICLVLGIGLAAWYAPQPVIGVVRFEDVIDFNTATELINLLEAARDDGRVAGVAMEILSPGGLATSSESAFYTMLKLREEKPLVVAIDGLAVSGGYYMAVAGNRIYAPSSSYVGNVGTRGPRPSDPAISPDELSSGPFKLSGGDRFDRIQQLELVKEAFVGNVVHQRSNAELNPLTIDAATVAEARIYLGSEAVAVGLVDAEGGISDAIAAAAELAGVDNYQVVNLREFLDMVPEAPPTPEIAASVTRMMNSAPPDAVFLLDSRMALPQAAAASDLDKQLMRLRNVDPATLSATYRPLETAPPTAGD
ncbi:MAG: S49 family peptidase [Caldilineaceae bacterium]|nr:S49 family peptidase [Caldilineaceae bacterium]MCB9161683.1 S49 family peptidase [Caldilineaceae bacterium]MCB9162735.1 S49 family peptidase [Caldilineaceae bacterium]